jgi:hypothetical protein
MTAERGHVSTSPAPGEGIADQLELLDRQIDRWAAAVRDLQASLRAVPAPAPGDEAEAPPAAPVAAPDQTPNETWAPSVAEAQPAVTEELAALKTPVPPQETTHLRAPEPAPPRDDDAALLAALDAETVTLIRVRQRLSPGRSVRDLLDELDGGKRKGGPGL